MFPESINSKVYRLQYDGLLREKSVPPSLPVYNKYMHAVDVTVQIRKTLSCYGFDRKSGVPGLDYFTNTPLKMHIYFINTRLCKGEER